MKQSALKTGYSSVGACLSAGPPASKNNLQIHAWLRCRNSTGFLSAGHNPRGCTTSRLYRIIQHVLHIDFW